MLYKDKILIISDDENDELFNKLKSFLDDDETISLDYARSDFESFKKYLRRNYFMIYIDYDNLNRKLRAILKDIVMYLLSMPLVVIAHSQRKLNKAFDIAYTINYQFISKDVLHNQVSNAVRILKYCRNVKTFSYLPGNNVISEVLERKFQNNEDFTIMYIDIDKFKAFTDYYGFFRAGRVITFMSDIIKRNAYKYGTPKDFIGHPGGDDFVLIFEDKEVAKKVGDKIVEEYDAGITEFYNKEDVEKGYIETLNREGEMDKFPISSVSIISITKEDNNYSSADEIFKEMMNNKKEAKDFSGSIMLEI